MLMRLETKRKKRRAYHIIGYASVQNILKKYRVLVTYHMHEVSDFLILVLCYEAHHTSIFFTT